MADEWLSQLTASPTGAFPPALTGLPQLRLEAPPDHRTDRRDGAE
jgi:hypothetical protein